MTFKLSVIEPGGQAEGLKTVRAVVLEFDGVKILADPGWDGDLSKINYLDSVMSEVDLVLLSHPTNDYLGLYAYLAYKSGKDIPVYATLPTSNLGRVSTIDLYRAIGFIGPLQGTEMELNDVEEAFDRVITIKHAQQADLRAKFDGLTLTAVNAGHTLGGTIWCIVKNSEKIVYAPQWNHSKDSFLNGADILQNPLLLRPSVIVTGSTIGSSLSHKKRIGKFLELVDATLGRGGTVLLPTTIGGRVLELIHLIDDHLQSAPIPVLLLSHAKARSLTYAGSMLEWMSQSVISEWESRGQVPFDASRVQVVQPKELLDLPGAKVVFASGDGFENGSSAQSALMTLCEDEKTTILLTERSNYGTIGSDLYFTWREHTARNSGKSEEGAPIALQKQLAMQFVREDLLVGDEKAQYEAHVKERRLRLEEAKKSKLAEHKQQFELADDDDDDDDEDDDDMLDLDKKEDTSFPVDLDLGSTTKTKMFPHFTARAKVDEYGEVLNLNDFVKEEEELNLGVKGGAKNEKGKAEKKKWNEAKKQDDVSDIDALFEPRKRSVSSMLISSRCVLSYVDLSGSVDIRSLALILPSLKPKHLVVLPDLTDVSNQARVAGSLKKHHSFDVVELTGEHSTFESDDVIQTLDLVLDDKLAGQLKWQKIAGGFTVAHVIAEVKTREELEKEKHDAEASAQDGDQPVHKDELVLAALPQSSVFASNVRSAPLAIGDVRLSELKKLLAPGHKVEFKGEGTLVVDEQVAIRKVTDGDVTVDGFPGPLFYEVRDAVRNTLAYV